MGYFISTRLHTSFENAVQRTRQTLAVQGFGVLTEIDVQATLRSRAGVDIEEYLILGACNPQFAHQAIDVNRQVGLLLQRRGARRSRCSGHRHRGRGGPAAVD